MNARPGKPVASARRSRWLLVAAAATALLGAPAIIAAHAALGSWRDVHPERRPVNARAAEVLHGHRDVAFEASDGTALSAWWHPSRNGAAIVLVHGQHATREQLLPQGARLAAAGFGVLLLDLRAHGASAGWASTWGDRERLDVRAAIDFVAAQPEVRADGIGVVGFSIGR